MTYQMTTDLGTTRHHGANLRRLREVLWNIAAAGTPILIECED